jgi:hypothetical protein
MVFDIAYKALVAQVSPSHHSPPAAMISDTDNNPKPKMLAGGRYAEKRRQLLRFVHALRALGYVFRSFSCRFRSDSASTALKPSSTYRASL